jgi:hypothetical protein
MVSSGFNDTHTVYARNPWHRTSTPGSITRESFLDPWKGEGD